MTDQQQGPGWWLASDGRWYPPDQAPAVPPPETWATPPPGPPPRSGMSGGAIAALSIAGVLGILVLLFGAVMFLGTSTESSSFSSTGAPIEGPVDDPVDDPETALDPVVVPEGFAVIDGDGVSIAAPARWQSIDADELAMGSEEFEAAFPDAPPELLEQGASAVDQGAVLVAFDFASEGFASNVNILEIPGEAPLAEIEQQATQQLGTIGGEVRDSGIVPVPGGEGLRLEYTLGVALPGGSSFPADGVQYYVPADGRTFVITVTADGGAADLGDQMIQTFRIT